MSDRFSILSNAPAVAPETSATPEAQECFSPESLRQLALMLSVYCVRNTIIEEYHANGQLSQVNMKAFNVEVNDKIYTALSLLFGQEFEPYRGQFLELLAKNYPSGWQTPELDAGMLRALGLLPSLWQGGVAKIEADVDEGEGESKLS